MEDIGKILEAEEYCLTNGKCTECKFSKGKMFATCRYLVEDMSKLLKECKKGEWIFQPSNKEHEPKALVRRWHKNPLGDYTRIHCPWCERELYETGMLKDYKVCPFCANPILYTNDSMIAT